MDLPRSVSAGDASRRLGRLIQTVNDDQVAIEIGTERGTAFLVSADEYRSLKETVYLLQSPANAARLRESLAEVAVGRAEERDLLP